MCQEPPRLGSSYDSYFAFSDPVVVALFWNASVTFDRKIVGVEVTIDGLNSGTPDFKNPSVFYGPSFSNLDGLELATFDSFNISADRYTLDVSLRSFAPGDRFRIITEGGGSVPEPASMATLGVGAITLLRRRRSRA